MQRASLLRIVPLIAVALLATAAHAQPTYPIRLQRSMNVGDRFGFATTFDMRQTLKVSTGGTDVQNIDSSFVILFDADVEVTQPLGVEQKVTVRRCLKVLGGDTSVMVQPGVVFTYRRDGHGKSLQPVGFELDDAALSEIDDAFPGSIHRPDDESVGTKRPQAIGGTWKIDPKNIAPQLSTSGSFEVDAKNMKAQGKLVSVSTAAPVPFMSVQIDLNLNKFKIPSLEGFKLSKSSAVFRVGGELPLDASKGPISSSLTMDMTLQGKGRPEPSMPEFTLAMTMQRISKTKYSYAN